MQLPSLLCILTIIIHCVLDVYTNIHLMCVSEHKVFHHGVPALWPVSVVTVLYVHVSCAGGMDKLVLLWDLTDACKSGGILGDTQQQQQQEEGVEDLERAPQRTTKLQAR